MSFENYALDRDWEEITKAKMLPLFMKGNGFGGSVYPERPLTKTMVTLGITVS